MPWRETDPLNERVQFIAAYVNQGYSMTELYERFGIRCNPGAIHGCAMIPRKDS
jgi:hypothetical protein